MKRIIAFLAIVPCLAFGLEKVNLIRNSGFEHNDVWVVEKGSWEEPNPAIGLSQDPSKSNEGIFSASTDTRDKPSWADPWEWDTVTIYQQFVVTKTFEDLDSLFWYQSVVSRLNDTSLSNNFLVGFTYANPERNGCGYGFGGAGNESNWRYTLVTFPSDTSWINYGKSLWADFEILGVSKTQELASFVLISWGFKFGTENWLGQKVNWDDIRLTGWADYDIALTSMTGSPFVPAARVWNNGREDQTNVKVIAEMIGDLPSPYADTVIIESLKSNDSIEVKFKYNEWVSGSGNYYVFISTGGLVGMEPDECDEDDYLFKEYLGVNELAPQNQKLDVTNIQAGEGMVRVSYSLPLGEQGTISLYDPSGRRIESLPVQGEGKVSFKPGPASGVYFVKLENGKSSITKKTVVLR